MVFRRALPHQRTRQVLRSDGRPSGSLHFRFGFANRAVSIQSVRLLLDVIDDLEGQLAAIDASTSHPPSRPGWPPDHSEHSNNSLAPDPQCVDSVRRNYRCACWQRKNRCGAVAPHHVGLDQGVCRGFEPVIPGSATASHYATWCTGFVSTVVTVRSLGNREQRGCGVSAHDAVPYTDVGMSRRRDSRFSQTKRTQQVC